MFTVYKNKINWSLMLSDYASIQLSVLNREIKLFYGASYKWWIYTQTYQITKRIFLEVLINKSISLCRTYYVATISALKYTGWIV